jgi:hypothetical protein
MHTRLGALALGAAGVLFVLYPTVRPWNDETTAAGALQSMGSGAWVASHLFAMIGFILVPLGLLVVSRIVHGTPGAGLAPVAVVTTWIGAGMTLPYYGAEDFALNAVANLARTGAGIDVPAVAEAVRYGPAAVTTFVLGLILLGVGAVLAAIAIARSGALPPASGILVALGFALFIPQFFGPPAFRIAHGVLLAAGLIWLAVMVGRADRVVAHS